MKRFFTIMLSIYLVATFSSFKLYAGGQGSCVGIGCDPHGAGVESVGRLIGANPRGPFGMVPLLGGAVGAIERAWASWVDINVPGASTSPNIAEHILYGVGEFTTTQAVLSAVPLGGRVGIGGAKALAGRFSLQGLEKRVGPQASKILEIASGGKGARYRGALKAWEHFHVKGRSWKTWKGPMVHAFRGQQIATEEILAQSARLGGIDATQVMLEQLKGLPPESIQQLFQIWQSAIKGRIPTVATAAEEAFAAQYPGRFAGGKFFQTPQYSWITLENPESVLYEVMVPEELVLGGPVEWWTGYTEIPVIHRIAPGMIRNVEVLPPREVIWKLFDRETGEMLVYEGKGIAGPFAP